MWPRIRPWQLQTRALQLARFVASEAVNCAGLLTLCASMSICLVARQPAPPGRLPDSTRLVSQSAPRWSVAKVHGHEVTVNFRAAR
jgi:hypothetical protein